MEDGPTISEVLKTCLKTLFVAILFGAISGVEIHTLPLRVYWAHSWRKAEGSSPDEYWQPCWTTLTVQPSHAWPGNKKQVHRWKKRIYRGTPKRGGLNPTSPSLFPPHTHISLKHGFVKSPVIHTMSLLLSCHVTWAHRMMPHGLVFFFIGSYWTSHQERKTSRLLLPSTTCFGYITFCLIHAICFLISTAWGTVILQSLNDPY